MIQMQTILNVADNSGAKSVQCIKVLGGSGKRYASVGDIIVVSVKKVLPNMIVKKKEVLKAVIVRTKKAIQRKDGTSVSCSDNAVVIIDNNKNPKGTRIFGPVLRELREFNFTKIISLASEVL